ncbi:uncharacterized protein LOC131226112 isoform X2 [Magnolia sinica]|uniref:uncharacterized protein LOC131226112 isoform X2 n=1 Tax=Magnolia sinica TaxID=86752 RepID=UPI00265AAFF5|nr:uncharacterized protein LOC131226112 isoform X2 [Magnolia sinica]
MMPRQKAGPDNTKKNEGRVTTDVWVPGNTRNPETCFKRPEATPNRPYACTFWWSETEDMFSVSTDNGRLRHYRDLQMLLQRVCRFTGCLSAIAILPSETMKKIVLRLQCQSCKHVSQHPI